MKWFPNDLPTPQSVEHLELPAQDKYNNAKVAIVAQLCCTFTLHTLRNYTRNKGQSEAQFDSSDSVNSKFSLYL